MISDRDVIWRQLSFLTFNVSFELSTGQHFVVIFNFTLVESNVEDNDSGMESQDGSVLQDAPPSKEFTPEKKPLELEEDYDNEPDETLTERLWGLTEMFPESVRTATQAACINTQTGAKTFYNFSRSALWIVFSTSIILFAPVIFEVERAQMEEMQRNQQKQMLLGPNTAVSGGGMPLMPPMQR